MTRKMNMELYGLRALQPEELVTVNGGEAVDTPSWLKKIGGIGVLIYISDNWDEIKREFRSGWNIDKK